MNEACEFLSTRHKINIVIDEQSLQDEGVMTDTSITLSIKDVRLKSVLRLMFNKLNLDYLVQNEVLGITTQARADEHLETHVYDVTPLKNIRLKRLISIIQNSIFNAIWADVDGDPNGGAIEAVPGLLIIKQTQRVHAGICDLLRQLMAARSAQEAAGVIICPRPSQTHRKRPKKKQPPPSFGRFSASPISRPRIA